VDAPPEPQDEGTTVNEDEMPPPHPDADLFDPGEDPATEGRCICGEAIPPRRRWHDPFNTWSWVVCMHCRTLVVDEDDFYAIYDEPRRAGVEFP
jgi:hypothetical protein